VEHVRSPPDLLQAVLRIHPVSNSVEPVTRIGFEELTTLYAVMPQRQGWRRAAQRSAGRLGAGARAFGGSGWTPIDSRTRRALLHLQYSCAAPFGPALLV